MNAATASIVATCLATCVACGNPDFAVLRADSLLVSPCKGDEARLFEPFELEADLLRWYGQGDTGFIEMRHGFRTPTFSDAIYLQVTDTAALHGIHEAAPGSSVDIDGGLVRLSVVMLGTCPDGTQPLVAGGGLATFTSFDDHIDGRIAGSATFDLYDGRTLGDAEPTIVGTSATLTFDMRIRRGHPYQEFTNPGD